MSLENPHILVVDDTAANRLILESQLGDSGYKVTLAANGREALDLLFPNADDGEESENGSGRFDAVVLDIMMPEVDGMQVLRQTRDSISSIDLPIIMATAKDRSADVVAALEAGANDYITKPIDTPILLARLSTQLELMRTHEALRKAQKSLIHAAKMESIGYLAAGVAHEIRNPLAQIQMGADGLKRRIEDDPNGATLLEIIEDGVNRSDEIVRGLMGFSQEARLRLSPGDLNELASSAVELIHEEGEAEGVHFETDFDETLPAVQLAHEDLKQAVLNILMNAIQAAPDPDGKIRVSTRLTVLEGIGSDEGSRTGNRPRDGDEVAVLTIEDNGPGIETENLIKVFDAFYTTRPTGSGSGLGLTIARNIVDLHEGLITVENSESEDSGARGFDLSQSLGQTAHHCLSPDSFIRRRGAPALSFQGWEVRSRRRHRKTAPVSAGKLTRWIVFWSALGILVTGGVIALATMLPLYNQLKIEQENQLEFAVTTRTQTVDQLLSRWRGIASQITSRTKAREKLEAWNRGEVDEG